MTEHNPEHNPMADVFQMDQALAAEDAATRDQVAWELHVQAQRSHIAAQAALAKRIRAWAGLIDVVKFALGTVVAAAVLVALVLAAQHVIGWFQ